VVEVKDETEVAAAETPKENEKEEPKEETKKE